MRRLLKDALFISLLVFLDRLAKFWALNSLKEGLNLGFFRFYLVRNTGTLFGLGRGFNLVWIATSLIIGAIVLISFASERKSLGVWGYCGFVGIISGAFSNLCDRFLYGGVIDFIDIRILPVFNLADIFITAGVILLGVWYLFLNPRK